METAVRSGYRFHSKGWQCFSANVEPRFKRTTSDTGLLGLAERWTWLQGLGRALMQLGDTTGAVDTLRQAVESNPAYLLSKAMLAAAEALTGNLAAARQHMAEYAAAEPQMTVQRFAEQRSSVPPDAVSPTYRQQNERILNGLRRAGIK